MSAQKIPLLRIALISVSFLFLFLIFVFQKTNYFALFFHEIDNPNLVFMFNKTIRLLANDGLCMLLILTLFREKKYLRVAFFLFVFELVIVLPIYFIIKLKMEGDSEISSPFLSQIHRLIVNPMLMFILMVGFYYQKYWAKNHEG